MDSISIAIVGAGYMAQEHARAFASLPNVVIRGVCGRSPVRAQELAAKYGARTFSSVAEMHAQTQADVVVVAVNELSMAAVAKACFEHPWVCLLEKPVGVDLAQAEEILAASRLGKARSYVALNRRWYASTRSALGELAADDSPRMIDLLDQQDIEGARAMGQPDQVLRNYMYANSIHLVDYFHIFGRGRVAKVNVLRAWNAKSPGLVVAGVEFESGDMGIYKAVWDGPGPWAVSVTTRQLRLEMRPLEKLGIQRRGERRLAEVPGDPRDVDFKPGLRSQSERIIAGLRDDDVGLPTLEDATRSMRLCARLYGLAEADEDDIAA